jgi:hypothetical protein
VWFLAYSGFLLWPFTSCFVLSFYALPTFFIPPFGSWGSVLCLYNFICCVRYCFFSYIQRKSFAVIQDDKIACKDPFLDEEGIIRLRTRFVEKTDVGDFAKPAVLPSHRPIVERLVLSTHVKSCHVVVQGCWVFTREVLGFEGLKKRQNHSVEVCQVQNS